MKNKLQKISYWKDITFQAIGNSTAQLIGIIGLPILTRLYAPENFAAQAIFIQITAFLTAFTTFRYEYFIPLAKNKKESLLLTHWVMTIGLVMVFLTTFLMLLIDLLADHYGSIIKIEKYYYLSPITAYLISLSFLFQHETQRKGNFRLSGFAEIASKITYIIAGIVGSFINKNLFLILTTAFGAIGKIFFLKEKTKHKTLIIRKNHQKVIKKYLSISIGMVLSNTLLTISGLIPIYILSRQYGVISLGQFSLVTATIFLPSGLIGSAVGNVFYQRAGLFFNQNDFLSLKNIWNQTAIKLIIFALPIYIIAFFITPFLYPLIFGPSWVEAGEYARILSIAAFFSFLAGPFDRLSLVLKLPYYLPSLHIIRLTSLIILLTITSFHKISSYSFILYYSLTMSFVYLIDIITCRLILNIKSNEN